MAIGDDLIDAVGALIRRTATEVVLPRFRALAEGEVTEKSPGEIATIADVEAEAALAKGLADLLADVPIVGEEAAADDPSLLDVVRDADRCWLVDPLDGTSNFASGDEDFAVMVGLVDHGDVVACWIHQPITGRLFVAERGSGATADGEPLRRTTSPAGDVRGIAKTKFLESPTADHVRAQVASLPLVTGGRGCAGVEYPLLGGGDVDFLLYGRTLPWDHAPGVLLAKEAGCVARRFDGTDYRAGVDAHGLLVAADDETWRTIRHRLLP